jgi:hypothetical protein
MLAKRRNHRVEAILENEHDDASIDQLRDLNKHVAGVVEPGNLPLPAHSTLQAIAPKAIAQHRRCAARPGRNSGEGPRVHNRFRRAVRRGDQAAVSGAPDYVKNWAALAADIYGDEYDPATVSKLLSNQAIGCWRSTRTADAGLVLERTLATLQRRRLEAGGPQQPSAPTWGANPTINDKARLMQNYNHPLAALP